MSAALYALAATVALLSASCSVVPDVPEQVAGCTALPVANIALRRIGEAVLLPATINGAPVQMKLDTGSDVSTISPGVAAWLRLPVDQVHGRLLRGVGGDVRTGSVIVDRFSLAGLPAQSARLSLGTADVLPGILPPVAGLLGTDLVAGRDIALDIGSLQGALYAPTACAEFAPWPGAAAVPLAPSPTGLSFVVVNVDGHAVRALVDTGAHTTFMTRRLALSLGVTDQMLAADPASINISISRPNIDVRRHRFDAISLGSTTWRNVLVGIADVSLPGVDMLLGADVLDRQAIWISSSKARLWLR